MKTLSVDEYSKIIGISPQYLRRMLIELSNNPPPNRVKKIMDRLINMETFSRVGRQWVVFMR